MQVLRLRKKTNSKIELAGLVVSTYCLLSNIKISKTEVEILAYHLVYGFRNSTKDLIIRSEILGSYNSLENALSKLRKMGLILKDNDRKDKPKPEIAFQVGNTMGIVIHLENV